ncbi:MAG: serine/threonine-protein kinase PknK, partial [Desulfobacteraceae bacterium]|nr:serine/threonine-protein kinase PknK [Desulfobacteraceae bacterium]
MSINMKDYTLYEQIYSSKVSTIYKGLKVPENKPVVLKHLNKEFPSSDDLSRFTREFRITRNLYGEGIIRAYALEKYLNSLVIIHEDFGGESLSKAVPTIKPDLEQKLIIAIRTAEALGQIHQQSIIHKDINPSNIVWNPRTGLLKIIDFGISTELSRENPEVRHPNILEGTINYISPEQTGRMNRAMDYRTDLYSLGVTFYELFTGELPFYAPDAMGMVHCHIAVMPKSPHSLNPEISDALSEIIMKLLSKAPEDRYQSALGLKRDLEFCLNQLTGGAVLSPFELGRHDISARFQIPQKLYGRKKDVDILLSAFDRVSSGAKELMLVSGYSGVGKSALVHEVNKPIVGRRGHFISGKFDQFKRNTPYSGLIQAFQELIKNLLAEHEDRLLAWKEKLTQALWPSGQLVIDVIPDVELIIGKQPPIQELDPDQARNRFHLVFQSFIRVFADMTHPLTLFVDDLQWADLPSLHLIEQFMLDVDTQYLLIIGAYRDNEVDASHPLLAIVDDLKKTGAAINTITLTPLDPAHVNQLIADVMACDHKRSLPLARLCHEKTLGNPFFLYQLLHSLYENSSLVFDAINGTWNFDVEQIRKADITENVVDLMVGKIRKLTPETQDILKLAACIGNTFDLATLAMVSEKSRTTTAQLLFEALKERLLIPVDDHYKFISESNDTLNADYRFLHDRILQAAYSLIPDDDKKRVHLKIGRLLLKNTPLEDRGEKLFDMANHLNQGSGLLTDPVEKELLAELN